MKLPPELFTTDEYDGYEYGWKYFDYWVKTRDGRLWVIERRFSEIWMSLSWWRRAIVRVVVWLKGVEGDE